MNSLAYLILVQSFLGAPEVVALDNGAIRIEVELDLFAIRYIGRPGGENFLDALYVRDSARRSEGMVESGGLTTVVEPLELNDPALSRGPARIIDSGPYHLTLIGPVAEASGLRLRKELRIDPVDAKAWFTVTVLSLRKEAVELSVTNSGRAPMGTTVSFHKPDDSPFHRLDDGGGRLPTEDTIDGIARVRLGAHGSGMHGRWGARIGRVVLENDTGTWIRFIDGLPAEGYLEDASLVLSINDEAMRYSIDLRSARADVDSATPLTHREAWQLEGLRDESEAAN